MAKITIEIPGSPYKTIVDTGAMQVEIRETFLGVRFVTANGEQLSVSMRDSGFEVLYEAEELAELTEHHQFIFAEFKGGEVQTVIKSE